MKERGGCGGKVGKTQRGSEMLYLTVTLVGQGARNRTTVMRGVENVC